MQNAHRALPKAISLLALLCSIGVNPLLCRAQSDSKANEPKVKERIETLPNRCDEYAQIPIGITGQEAIRLLGGEPTEKNDISIFVYTWRIGDNFLTLHYDRGQLTSVEVDNTCQQNDPREICDYFEKYRVNWPEYEVVEYEIGKPIDTQKVERIEWIWKNRGEKVYLELKNNEVEDIECLPNRIRYIFEEEAEGEGSDAASDEYQYDESDEENY